MVKKSDKKTQLNNSKDKYLINKNLIN